MKINSCTVHYIVQFSRVFHLAYLVSNVLRHNFLHVLNKTAPVELN